MPAFNNVTLSQIRAFERTVRLGGVHAAARHLGLTQPAVSRRIRELELALGIKVFVRSGRTLRISPDGAALLTYADELLSTADEMAARVSTGDPLRGTLRLGVSGSFASGTDVPEVKTRLDLLLKKATAKGIHVMGPALPPTPEQAQKMAAAGFKAILLRNDLFCVRTICKQYIDDIAGPIRGN